MAELIFIEGVSGVGKSTMVRRLADELCAAGYRARAYVEFDFTNPIDFYCTAYLKTEAFERLCAAYPDERPALVRHAIFLKEIRLVRYYNDDIPLFSKPLLRELALCELCYQPKNPVSLQAYQAALIEVWQAFAESLTDDWDYLLFDGSLLHHPINDMIRNYDINAQQAETHITALLNALGATARRIFYLTTPDLQAQLTRARKDRGEPAPTAEDFAFWAQRGAYDTAVLSALDERIEICSIVEDGWETARAQVLRTLTQTNDRA